MQTENRKLFLSYSHLDKDIAVEIANDFNGLNCDVWFDQELKIGQNWWEEILQHICDCDVFSIVVSTHLLKSEACLRELDYAIKLNRTVIPVQIHDVKVAKFPTSIQALQWLDYRKKDKAAVIEMAQTLFTLPKQISLPKDMPEPPAMPIEYAGDWLRRLNAVVNDIDTLDLDTQRDTVNDLLLFLDIKEFSEEAASLLTKMKLRRELAIGVLKEVKNQLDRYNVEKSSKVAPTNSILTTEAETRKSSQIQKWVYLGISFIGVGLITYFIFKLAWAEFSSNQNTLGWIIIIIASLTASYTVSVFFEKGR